MKMRILLLLLTFWLPLSGFAADASAIDPSKLPPFSPATQNANSFNQDVYKFSLTPAVSDISLNYLGFIFGNVDGVLQGAGSQMLGTMFGVYNMAILSLGGIVLMYTLIVSTLNTAHEGEIMGKKWSSIWIPIRSAMGVALLIPKASGYSVIQILMMWIVVQGIGAANSVWNAATTYLQMGGVFVVRDSIGGGSSMDGFRNIELANNMYKSAVCMAVLEDRFRADQQAAIELARSQGTPLPYWTTIPIDLANTVRASAPTAEGLNPLKTGKIALPGSIIPPELEGKIPAELIPTKFKGYEGKCGTLVTPENDLGSLTKGGLELSNYTKPQIDAIVNARAIAAVQMLYDLMPAARQAVKLMKQRDQDPNNKTPLSDMAGTEALRSASATYARLLSPALNIYTVNTLLRNQVESMKADGWLMAGSYFNVINRSGGTAMFDKDYTPARFQAGTVPETVNMTSLFVPNYLNANQVEALFGQSGFVQQYITGYGVEKTITNSWGEGKSSSDNARSIKMPPIASLISSSLFPSMGPAVDGIVAAIDNYTRPIFDFILNIFASADNTPPMTKIATMGATIITLSEQVIAGLMALIVVASVATGFVPFITVSVAVNTLTHWLVPIMMTLIFSLWGFSAMMAYYIPMIPYLLFTFVSLGWFFAVIEAMIAAPLVALGLVHPEGEGAFGKAESAILMVVNVFLKPTLIIFGFVSGIIVSYIALWLLNKGFGYLYITSILSPGMLTSFMTVILAVIVFLGTYAVTALLIVQKCFNLIHEVPARVLGWIGHRENDFGLHHAAEEIRNKVPAPMERLGGAAAEINKGLGEQNRAEKNQAKEQGEGKLTGRNTPNPLPNNQGPGVTISSGSGNTPQSPSAPPQSNTSTSTSNTSSTSSSGSSKGKGGNE